MAKQARSSKPALAPTPEPTKRPRPTANVSPTPSVWDQLSNPVQHASCALILLAVAFGFFSATTFGDLSLVGSDSIQARGMAKSVLEYQTQTGEQALWATNGFGGMPTFAISYPNRIPQADSIVRFLNQVLAFPVVPFLVMLFGMYWLAFYLTKDKLLGVFAAGAYGLTTYLPLILLGGHNTKYSTLAWTPYLVLSFIHLLRHPKILHGLFFAAVLAVNLRANHIQITYYAFFLLAGIWVAELIKAFRKQSLQSFGLATGFLIAGGVLAGLMVAQPYFPLQEYKAFTIRGASEGGSSGALDWTYAMNWSQGVGELWTLLIPKAYGGSSQEGYWGEKIFTGGPHYIGGIVVLLAMVALWRKRSWTVWALGASTFLTILFSLGKNAPFPNEFMFHYFPLFNAFRVPETWLIITVLGLVILAVYGLQVVFDETSEGKPAQDKAIFAASGALVGVLILVMVMKSAFFSFERPNEADQIAKQIVAQAQQSGQNMPLAAAKEEAKPYIAQFKQEREMGFQEDAQRALLFLALAIGLMVAFRLGKLPAFVGKLGLALLVLVDLWGVANRYFKEEALHPKTDVEQLLQNQKTEADDWILAKVKETGGAGQFRTFSLMSDPSGDGRTPYFYETLSGYHGAKLRIYQDYLDHILQTPEGRINLAGLDLMATRYIVANGILPGTRPVHVTSDSSTVILERENALPRAWFVGNVETVSDPKTVWAKLREEGFNPRKTAYVAKAPSTSVLAPYDSTNAPSVTLKSFTPNRIEWRVKTDKARLMVASEVYYPAGWTASVDGAATEILQTNYVLRGVVVPQGEHSVVMTFNPPRHAMSVMVSGIATVLCYGGILVFLGLAFLTRRKGESPATVDETTR